MLVFVKKSKLTKANGHLTGKRQASESVMPKIEFTEMNYGKIDGFLKIEINSRNPEIINFKVEATPGQKYVPIKL